MNKVVIIICVLGACAAEYPSSRYLPAAPEIARSAIGPFNALARSQYSSGRFGSQYSSGRNAYGSAFGNLARSNFGRSFGGIGRYQGINQYGRLGRNQYDQAAGYNGNEINEPAQYEFKYDVNAPEYAVEFGHEEQRDGDLTSGAYYVLLPDGRRQLVEYTADTDGYHPRVSYIEPANNGRFLNNGYTTGAGSAYGSARSAYGSAGSARSAYGSAGSAYGSTSSAYQSRSNYQGNNNLLTANVYSGIDGQAHGY